MMPLPARLLAGLTPGGVPLARQIVRSGLARVFGPPPFDPAADPGDPGLFGPGSASWRIVGEPASICGGVRALLVQVLHPLAVAGVADHSRFREDPLGRLRATSAYVGATTFGSTRQALAAARTVRRVHRWVRGTAPDGRRYRASDPRLLTWVSMSLTASFLATDRAYALTPLAPRTADRFVAEQARAAALLDPRVDLRPLSADPRAAAAMRAGDYPLPMVDDGGLPCTAAELSARRAEFDPELGLGDQGRQVLGFLLWPDVAAPVKAGYLALLAGAVATLADGDRRLLGLPGGPLVTWPLLAQGRGVLGALRLVAGTSPSLRAATRRVRAAAA